MPSPLSEEQNKRVREVARELIAQYKGNVSAATRALKKKKDPSWLGRVARGELGASLDTATLICTALGRDVSSVLGITPKISTLSDLPGYDIALAKAKAALPSMDEAVWMQIGRISLGVAPQIIEDWMLISLAQFVSALNAKPLTTPPRDPRDSVRRLRTVRRG